MLIIGLGNEFRGDDAIGVEITQSLKKTHPQLGEYLIEQGDSSRLLSSWEKKDTIIIDAVASDPLEAGTLCISHSIEELIDHRNVLFSTHGLDLGHVLELAKDLKKPPKSIYFIGVVGKKWGMGEPMSESVTDAFPGVKKRIVIYAEALEMKE